MKRFIAFVFLLICIAACQKAPFLSMTGPRSFNFTDEGGKQSLSFTCNRDWHISSSDSWIQVSPSSGTATDGEVTITITCEPNTTYDPRNATFAVKVEELSETVSVSQETNYGIIVPTKSYDLSSAANTIEVEVQANVQYAVSISDTWVKQTGTKGLTSDKLLFSVEVNETYYSRSATITIEAENGVSTQTINLEQEGRQIPDEVVDLGLVVKDYDGNKYRILWAKCNLGATKPEEYGDYYAWGEVSSYCISQDPLVWKEGKEGGYCPQSYSWANGYLECLTKYCFSYTPTYWNGDGEPDNKSTLEPEDDAVCVSKGGDWRMPTLGELSAVRGCCDWTWTNLNGVAGYLGKCRRNENTIFLPAAGSMVGTKLKNAGTVGTYWSSSLFDYNPHMAGIITFDSNRDAYGGTFRDVGLPIRPVFVIKVIE